MIYLTKYYIITNYTSFFLTFWAPLTAYIFTSEGRVVVELVSICDRLSVDGPARGSRVLDTS